MVLKDIQLEPHVEQPKHVMSYDQIPASAGRNRLQSLEYRYAPHQEDLKVMRGAGCGMRDAGGPISHQIESLSWPNCGVSV